MTKQYSPILLSTSFLVGSPQHMASWKLNCVRLKLTWNCHQNCQNFKLHETIISPYGGLGMLTSPELWGNSIFLHHTAFLPGYGNAYWASLGPLTSFFSPWQNSFSGFLETSVSREQPSKCRADTAVHHCCITSQPPSQKKARPSRDSGELQYHDCRSKASSEHGKVWVHSGFGNRGKQKHLMYASLALGWLTGTC